MPVLIAFIKSVLIFCFLFILIAILIPMDLNSPFYPEISAILHLVNLFIIFPFLLYYFYNKHKRTNSSIEADESLNSETLTGNDDAQSMTTSKEEEGKNLADIKVNKIPEKPKMDWTTEEPRMSLGTSVFLILCATFVLIFQYFPIIDGHPWLKLLAVISGVSALVSRLFFMKDSFILEMNGVLPKIIGRRERDSKWHRHFQIIVGFTTIFCVIGMFVLFLQSESLRLQSTFRGGE